VKVLVIGKSGQLASEIRRARWPDGSQVVCLGRPELDVTDEHSVARGCTAITPDLIVNASAYTAVDRAETEPDAAFAINRRGPEFLARQAKRLNIPIVHVSTDYVFNGKNSRPWREDDTPNPSGVYGRSKLEGERAIRAAWPNHVIVRTSWVFAAHGQNFVRTMLRLGAERDTLKIVDDQIGCPTPAADLARVIVEILSAIACGQSRYGVYHYCGAEAVSWFEFARAIFAASGDLVPKKPALVPITTAEFGAQAPRPAWSVLDCSKIHADYGIRQKPWRDGLAKVLRELHPDLETMTADAR
jgi:dTDP-4-dehydrorhamnose reductase